MSTRETILLIIAAVELILIIVLIIRRDRRKSTSLDDLAMTVMSGVDISPSFIDRHIDRENRLFAYIVKAYAFFNRGEYKKCKNLLQTVLAMKGLGRGQKNAIFYLIAKSLLMMNKYEEALIYCDKIKNGILGLGREPDNIFLLRTAVGFFNGQSDSIEKFIEKSDNCQALNTIIEAYHYTDNHELILRALNNGLNDSRLLSELLVKAVKSDKSRHIIMKDIGPVMLSLEHVLIIIRWMKSQKTEGLPDIVLKSHLHPYIRKSLHFYALHIAGEDETQMKLIIDDIRKHEMEWVRKNPYIITEILMETGYYRYAQLFF